MFLIEVDESGDYVYTEQLWIGAGRQAFITAMQQT